MPVVGHSARLRIRPVVLAAVALVVPLLPLLPGTADAAPKRPDLVTSRVTLGAATVTAGRRLAIRDAVRNIGRAKAARSSVGYWLSRDAKVGRGDLRLGTRRQVKSLRPRQAHTGTSRVAIPVKARGRYRVIVCADVRRTVRESRERNNCRVARPVLTVKARPAPPVTRTWSGATPALRVISRGADRVELSWPPTATGQDRSRYRLTWGGQQRVLSPGVLDTTVSGLAPGSSTNFTLTALNAAGTALPGSLSTTAATVTGLQPPADLTLTTGAADAGGINPWHEYAPPREMTSEVSLRGAAWEYSLSVPNGALPGGETIRMREITALSGIQTSGGLVTGVQLEPSGLLLAEPAVLEIRPRAGTTAPANVIPLVFDGDGDNARLIGIDPASQTYRFQISHFSGVAVMAGSDAELDAQVQRARTEAERSQNRVYEQLALARQDAMTGAEPDPGLEQMLQREFDLQWSLARVLLQAATTNDRLANEAVTTALGLLRGSQLMGLESVQEEAEFRSFLPAILQNAYDAAYRRCRVGLDPREAHTMLSHLRMAQMVGVELIGDAEDALACAATTIKVDLVGSFDKYDVPANAGVCCAYLSRAGGRVVARAELRPMFNAGELYYGGVGSVALSGLFAEHPKACSVSVGAAHGGNAMPLVARPDINPSADRDRRSSVHLEIDDFFDLKQQPYFRTGFDVTYVPRFGDECGNAVTTTASAWASFPVERGGLSGPWKVIEGTPARFRTSSPQYPNSNIGGSADFTVTMTPVRGGIG